MKDWETIDFYQVKELLEAYDICTRLMHEYSMFELENVVATLELIREAIRIEVEGKSPSLLNKK